MLFCVLLVKQNYFSGSKNTMDFVDLILVSQVDRVIMHACPYKQPVDGTMCITGHHLILSSRKKGIDELLVNNNP